MLSQLLELDRDKWVDDSKLQEEIKGVPTYNEMKASVGRAVIDFQAPGLSETKVAVEGAVEGVPTTYNTMKALAGETIEVLQTLELNDIIKFHEEHPALARSAGIGLLAVGGVAVLPTAGLVVANAAGFSAVGPVAGSLAAGIQSYVYGATTGGVFSIVQGFAMTSVPAAAHVLAGGGAAIIGGLKMLGRGSNKAND